MAKGSGQHLKIRKGNDTPEWLAYVESVEIEYKIKKLQEQFRGSYNSIQVPIEKVKPRHK